MIRKGKKKQQQNKQNVSTSDTTSNEPSQSQSTSQQQQTELQRKISQQSVEKPQEQVLQQQLQGVQAQRKEKISLHTSSQQQQQQQTSTHSSQQPQGAEARSQQRQQQIPTQPFQQQPQAAWVRPQQQVLTQSSQQQLQGAWALPQQQQQPIPIQLSQQPQGPWVRSQQQQQPIQLSQQPQGPWVRPQQQQQPMPIQLSQQPQRSWVRLQRQQQPMPIQLSQQPQRLWVRPQRQQQPMPIQSLQQPQGAWVQPQQQQQPMPIQPSQQPQGAWVRPQQQQQQMPTQPFQQQPQGAWVRPQQQQQQMPTQLSQQQPQGAWVRPQQQQQQMPTQPSQQQPQGAWVRPQQQQQQMSIQLSQQQPQGTWAQQQIRISSESQQTKFMKGDSFNTQQSQPSTSAESLQVSELSLRDTLQTTKTSSKSKMTSSAMKQYQSSIPKRRNPLIGGTLGTKICVLTNMYKIIFEKDFATNAVHYDVTITPNAPKLLHKNVFEKCRSTHFDKRFPAYDGKKNAYSANDLPFNDYMETEVEIFDNERDKHRTFTIALKKVAVIDLSWIKNLRPGLDEENRTQTALQVLDIIMRHAFENKHFSVGRSIYWDIDTRAPLGNGLCLGRGAFLSAVAGWQSYLNVDVANKGFPSTKNVVDVMTEFQDSKSLRLPFTKDEWTRIEKFLKNLKVVYEIPNVKNSKRTYRLNGLGPTANEHKFDCDGKLITIREYFVTKKEYSLKYPDLCCLSVGATDRKEKIYLPAELCTIMLQSYNRKLDEKQTASMIRKAVTDAPTRKSRIEEAFDQIKVNESATVTREFHMSVDTEITKVPARILPPPELRYATKTATVNNGTWQMHHFKQAESLSKDLWAIVDLSNRRADMMGLSNMLMTHAGSVGMRIDKTQWITSIDNRVTQNIRNYFFQRKQENFRLIVVIVPSTTDTYSKVKQITELEIGILTQCIKFDTVYKIMNRNITTLKNILLKINSKLNGINHIFDKMPMCLQNNSCCMLVGADVTHPSPDATNIPSIAAVAASQDTVAFQYNAELRLQPPKEEMILDLENIIISQMFVYRKKTKCLPKKIIYYRDGVSEGQLAQVMHFEIEAIRRACKKVNTGKDIEITCLVVQKRHHVRLFPTEKTDRNGNVRAGTIVDTEITHPDHIDFYLVSHTSIQGTARPTKYRCICNDSNFTEDQIEQLTYYLCHMYARCARAVSYPAPTYYAHLAAYRGRALIQGIDICLDNLESEQQQLKMNLAESPMYFI